MPSIVSKETFNSASEATKSLIIYDMLIELHIMIGEHTKAQTIRSSEYDKRLLKIERRKVLNASLTVLGSFFGGLAALGLKLKFWP